MRSDSDRDGTAAAITIGTFYKLKEDGLPKSLRRAHRILSVLPSPFSSEIMRVRDESLNEGLKVHAQKMVRL